MRLTAVVLACAALVAVFGCASADPARRQRVAIGWGGGNITAPDAEGSWVDTGFSLHGSYGYTVTPPDSNVQVAAECSLVRQGTAHVPVGDGVLVELNPSMMLMPAIRLSSPSRLPVVFSGSVGATVVRTSVVIRASDLRAQPGSMTSLVPGFAFGFGSGFAPRVTWWFGVRGVRGAMFAGLGGQTLKFHTSAGALEVAVLF